MKKKIQTMAELSKVLGMSRATLSKYFQDPSSVKGTTKTKIENALHEVDYVPNFFARNMNRRKTKLVGIVIPHMNDLFYTSLIEAIEQCAKREEYTIITQNSHGNRKDEILALENLRSMNAEGVIIAPIGAESDVSTFERVNNELSLVFVDASLPNSNLDVPFVGTNNNQSIRLLVDYLCRSGMPPAFLGMPISNSNSSGREQVYTARMLELGHHPFCIKVAEEATRWDFENYAYNRIRTEFEMGRHLDSTILCASDRLAMGVLRAANEFGLFKKETAHKHKFRVAGHDDHPLSGYLCPSLTTVSQDVTQMGQIAFEMVIQRDASTKSGVKEQSSRLLNAQLILRDSA